MARHFHFVEDEELMREYKEAYDHVGHELAIELLVRRFHTDRGSLIARLRYIVNKNNLKCNTSLSDEEVSHRDD